MYVGYELSMLNVIFFITDKMDKTKEEFVYFVRDAISDKNSDAYIELYQFLLGCFVRADKNFTGKVSVGDFDAVIEEAAALPRRYGFIMYPMIFSFLHW